MMLPLPQLHVAVQRGPSRAFVVIANRSLGCAERITVSLRDPVTGLGWSRLLEPMRSRTLGPTQRMRLELASHVYGAPQVPTALTLTVRWRDASLHFGCWSDVVHL